MHPPLDLLLLLLGLLLGGGATTTTTTTTAAAAAASAAAFSSPHPPSARHRHPRRRPFLPPWHAAADGVEGHQQQQHRQQQQRQQQPESPQERVLSWARSLPPPSPPSSSEPPPPTTSTSAASDAVYVSPAIVPLIRPPAEGGAGLAVTEFVPYNATLAVLPLDSVHFGLSANSVIELLDDGPVRRRLIELMGAAYDEGEGEGDRAAELAATVGAVAHLHLLRLRSFSSSDESKEEKKEGVRSAIAGRVEDRFGPYLDCLPLLPPLPREKGPKSAPHPFPTNVLYWTDSQISSLLSGTAFQSYAKFHRAAAGEAVGMLSRSFVAEHCPNLSAAEVSAARDAIVSAFGCVKSRTFDVGGGGGGGGYNKESGSSSTGSSSERRRRRLELVPVLDVLNHSPPSSGRNVLKTAEESNSGRTETVAVMRASRDIEPGEELLIDYGPRAAWDWGTVYGFVPTTDDDDDYNGGGGGDHAKEERALVPLLPDVLVRDDGTELDLTSAGDGTGADAVRTIRVALDGMGGVEVMPLFGPGGRRRTCAVLRVAFDDDDEEGGGGGGRGASLVGLRGAMAAFRAAACVLAALGEGRAADSDEVRQAAAASAGGGGGVSSGGVGNGDGNGDGGEDEQWRGDGGGGEALALLLDGIEDRIDALVRGGEEAEEWAAAVAAAAAAAAAGEAGERRQEGGEQEDCAYCAERLDLADRVRRSELRVLQALRSKYSRVATALLVPRGR